MGRWWRDSCLFTPMHGTRMFSSFLILFWVGRSSCCRPGAAADAQEDSTHTCPGVCYLFQLTQHRLHHVLPEKFLRNFLFSDFLKRIFLFLLFFGYKQTGSSYLLLVTPPPYSSFLLAWCVYFDKISNKRIVHDLIAVMAAIARKGRWPL